MKSASHYARVLHDAVLVLIVVVLVWVVLEYIHAHDNELSSRCAELLRQQVTREGL